MAVGEKVLYDIDRDTMHAEWSTDSSPDTVTHYISHYPPPEKVLYLITIFRLKPLKIVLLRGGGLKHMYAYTSRTVQCSWVNYNIFFASRSNSPTEKNCSRVSFATENVCHNKLIVANNAEKVLLSRVERGGGEGPRHRDSRQLPFTKSLYEGQKWRLEYLFN